jgi:sulfur-carrier protein
MSDTGTFPYLHVTSERDRCHFSIIKIKHFVSLTFYIGKTYDKIKVITGGDRVKITVKLFATFRMGRQKIMDMELPEGAVTKNIIDELGIDMSEVAILLINGRDGQMDRELVSGDVVALFPPVGGG